MPFRETVQYWLVVTARRFVAEPEKASKKLALENLSLRLKIKEYDEVKKENERLRHALQFQDEKKAILIGGEVIAFDPSSWRRQVIISRGSRHGVKKGLYVIDSQGCLIGKIAEVTANYSKLSLLSDPDFFLPVFVGANALGLLEGGLDRIKVLYVENSEEIKNGDPVWCKPIGVAFPIPIGEIRNARRADGEMFQQIEVKVLARHPNLRTVYILK